MTQLSIAFQTDQPLSAYGPLAAAAEAHGFDMVSVYNDMLYQPAFPPLFEMARATKRVLLGPAAVNPFMLHPLTIAGEIALLDEASQGRAYLGIARGTWLDFVGIEPRHTVTALRESFEAVRHLLRQDRAPYAGKRFPLAGGDALRWTIRRAAIPFLLGAWGVRTIRACAHIVDEVKIGGTANPALMPFYRQVLDDAAQQAGRARGSIRLAVGAVCVVSRDRAAALELVRRKAALYLPVIAPLDHTLQIEPERLARISAAAAAYDFERAAHDIPDDLLRRVAFAGTAADVAAHAHALFAAGVDRIEFGTPHGLSEDEGITLLGEQVLPALRTSAA